MKHRMIGVILGCVVIIVSIFALGKRNAAKEAEFSVEIVHKNTARSKEVKHGDEFTIKILVKSSMELGKLEAYMSYDEEKLEFISSTSNNVNGATGTLHILETFSTPRKEMEYTVTMKAQEIGVAKMKLYDIVLEDENEADVVVVHEEETEIVIVENHGESQEVGLSDLIIYPGTLSPVFDSMQLEYQTQVSKEVKEVILSVVPKNEESEVTIAQPEELVVGNNKITITVTAPSGGTKTYVIFVDKTKE